MAKRTHVEAYVRHIPPDVFKRLKELCIAAGGGPSNGDVIRWAALQYLKIVEAPPPKRRDPSRQ